MSNFKVHVDGLAELKSWLKKDNMAATVVPDVSLAILKFHNVLERRVGEVFTAKNSLNSVMIGRSVSNAQLGNTLLRFSLQYQDKPLPLSDFDFEVDSAKLPGALSTAPLRVGKGPLGFVKWTLGEWSHRVAVKVRRNREQTSRTRQPVFESKGKLLARNTGATWAIYPSKGEKGDRTDMTDFLFGPSLAAQARGIYENDATAQAAKEKMTDEIVTAFAEFYTK